MADTPADTVGLSGGTVMKTGGRRSIMRVHLCCVFLSRRQFVILWVGGDVDCQCQICCGYLSLCGNGEPEAEAYLASLTGSHSSRTTD